MSATTKSSYRAALLAGVVGLVVGILIGWLAIGWLLWPVQYVGEAYTYELNLPDKINYVAALVDSYSLRRQVDLVRQRLASWPLEDKITTLAELYARYEREGMAVEAHQIVELTGQLKQVEGWDASVVNTTLSSLVARYLEQGDRERAQFISLFGSEIGLVSASPGEEAAPPAARAAPSPAAGGAVEWILPILLAVLGVVVVVLVVLFLMQRRSVRTTAKPTRGAPSAPVMVPSEPGALLSTLSTYELGMDSFDESFSIEENGVFKGECGMGISEVIGEDRPRKVVALELWLFDKGDIRTITKVLASEYAYNDELLRNRLSARGEAVLAQPGTTLVLETAALSLKATVLEVEYGTGEDVPPRSFFKRVNVALSARSKTTGAEEMPVVPEEMGSAPEEPSM